MSAAQLTQYPITRQMPNGATVGDWLGTAATAADVAALLIKRVRNNVATLPIDTLNGAEQYLTQALDELRTTRATVEHRAIASLQEDYDRMAETAASLSRELQSVREQRDRYLGQREWEHTNGQALEVRIHNALAAIDQGDFTKSPDVDRVIAALED
jgi:chromosome segregation ATPase